MFYASLRQRSIRRLGRFIIYTVKQRRMEKDMEYKFTTENFEAEVLNSELPVLVDFYADWCGPCKMMAPVIEQLAKELDGKFKIGKCDTDDNMPLAQKYRVASIPNMQVFKNGEVVANFVGAMSADELRDKLQALL